MDGSPLIPAAAAVSWSTDCLTRSAFIAATRHFLHSHEHQPQFRKRGRPPNFTGSQSQCSSCGRGPVAFGVSVALGQRRRVVQCREAKGGESTPSDRNCRAPTSGRISFGLGRLSCGVASLAVAAAGSSKFVGARWNVRSKLPRQGWEPAKDPEPKLLARLLAPFQAPGRFWTNLLLAANIVVFLGQLAAGGDRAVMMGAKVNELIARGQYWRFITANFLHAGVSHLLMNCYSLNNVGPSWERVAGGPRFVIVYAVASLATVAASYVFNPQPSVGASGAIFGLVGALTVFSYRYMRLFRDGEGRALFDSLLRTVAVNALLGVAIQRWDNWGHAGGFLGGAAAAWILGPSYEMNYYAGFMEDRPPLKRILEYFRDRKGSRGPSS